MKLPREKEIVVMGKVKSIDKYWRNRNGYFIYFLEPSTIEGLPADFPVDPITGVRSKHHVTETTTHGSIKPGDWVIIAGAPAIGEIYKGLKPPHIDVTECVVMSTPN